MNPLEEYIAIIHNRQQDPLPQDAYGEVHHIIPRSCGGCNKKWNKVKLTPEEHYKAHELLPFIYTKGKEHTAMVRSWNQMNGRVNGKEVDADTYARLKEEYSGLMKGNKNRLGRHLSEETRRKMSDARKGIHYSEETRRKMSEAHKGRHPSEETLRKRSASLKGKRHSEETKRKMSKARKGKHPSDEARRKMSEAHKGRHPSEETLRKRSASLKGKHPSDEARRKMSEVNKGRPGFWKGKSRSEETKRKMSEAHKLYWENKRKEKWK